MNENNDQLSRRRHAMSKNKKKSKLGKVLFALIFIIGMAVLAFPLVSQYMYYQAAKVDNSTFRQGVENLSKDEIQERISLAKAFNDSLYYDKSQSSEKITDPYSEEERKAGQAEYARMLEINEQIGYLVIPKITQELPVFAGSEEKVLQKGVGHLEGTSLPVGGNNTHSVLTAHRGLPNARLFTDLDKLEVGDYFYFHNLAETLAYQVDDIKVIEPTEIDHLKIFPGHDYITLLTCTPYMINSHRLLVRGHQVPYDQAVEERQFSEHRSNNIYRYLFYGVSFLLVLLLLVIFFKWLKNRKKKKVQGPDL